MPFLHVVYGHGKLGYPVKHGFKCSISIQILNNIKHSINICIVSCIEGWEHKYHNNGISTVNLFRTLMKTEFRLSNNIKSVVDRDPFWRLTTGVALRERNMRALPTRKHHTRGKRCELATTQAKKQNKMAAQWKTIFPVFRVGFSGVLSS